MANYPDIGFREAQEGGYIRPCLLVVEGHDDYGPFAFF